MFTEKVEELVKLGRPHIAFGLNVPDAEILESLERAKQYADITLVGSEAIKDIKGFEIITSDDPNRKIIDILLADEVDGMVRGTLDTHITYEYYQEKTGEDVLFEPALIQATNGHQFFMAPVSNREAWDLEEKLQQVIGTAKFIKEWGVEPKVAITTGIRIPTYERKKDVKDGWVGMLNKTHEDAEHLVAELKKEGIGAKNYEIESNTALKDGCNLLIAPNGMVGNQMFRMLLFSGAKILAATRVGLSKFYEENSRTEKDFEFHVKWIAAMINKKNNA